MRAKAGGLPLGHQAVLVARGLWVDHVAGHVPANLGGAAGLAWEPPLQLCVDAGGRLAMNTFIRMCWRMGGALEHSCAAALPLPAPSGSLGGAPLPNSPVQLLMNQKSSALQASPASPHASAHGCPRAPARLASPREGSTRSSGGSRGQNLAFARRKVAFLRQKNTVGGATHRR